MYREEGGPLPAKGGRGPSPLLVDAHDKVTSGEKRQRIFFFEFKSLQNPSKMVHNAKKKLKALKFSGLYFGWPDTAGPWGGSVAWSMPLSAGNWCTYA